MTRLPLVIAWTAAWLGSASLASAGPLSVTTTMRQAATQCGSTLWLQFNSKTRPRNAGQQNLPAVAMSYPAGTTDEAVVKHFWSLAEQIQKELNQRQLAPLASPSDFSGIAWLVDRAAVGFINSGTGPSRFLALHMAIGNRTASEVVIAGDSIVATIDGKARKLQPIDEILKNRGINGGFSEGGTYFSLRDCNPPKELKVPSQGVASAWLIFSDVEGGPHIPSISLKFDALGKTLEFDVREHQRARMQITVEKLGPQQNLALITIAGTINAVNSQSLVDELDTLVNEKIVRVVLRFSDTAAPLDGNIANWLQSTVANSMGLQFNNQQMPAFTAQLRELHLVKHPKGGLTNPNTGRAAVTTTRFHESDVDAVAAALRTTYFLVPSEQVRQQIQQGHPLSRAAALIHGSSRLTPADLAVILPFTSDEDATIRSAAIRALREFREPAAIDRLEAILRTGSETDSQVAIDALADSRFADATDRLRQLMQTAEPAVVDRIIGRLASNPRPAWSNVLLAYANSQPKLRIEVLKALVQLDHPEVVDLLERGLNSDDKAVREFVFPILSRRSDERSYRLASDYVLKKLADSPPDSVVIEFLNRSRDQRALPLLRNRMEGTGDKATIINLLAAMGDAELGPRLVADFDKLSDNEKVTAVNALRILREPGFLQIAAKAIGHQHLPVAQQTIQTLIQLGTPEAEQLLIQAFENPPRDTILSSVANALVTLRTTATRKALVDASQSENLPKRTAARNGLQNLRNNSPARNTIMQATQFAQQEQWKSAAELFFVATQLDDFLPEAFSGLGDASLKLEKWPEAEAAFQQAVELNSEDGHAISGWAIAEIMQGRREAAFERVETARPRFSKDAIFIYNVACVYGRAAEKVAALPASPERDEQLKNFQQRACQELQGCLKIGFNQVDWMQRDPDLKSLHDLPEFQEIVKTAKAKAPKESPQPRPQEDE